MADPTLLRIRAQATVAAAVALAIGWRWPAVATTAVAVVAAALAIVAWLLPALAQRLHRGLVVVGRWLLQGLTWILLALVYGTVVIPISAWRRMRGRDPLRQNYDRATESYLQPCPPSDPDHFKRPF